MNEDENPPSSDTLKVVVATDTHLGYVEKNSIRGQDSFVTFEEILQFAHKNDVDFVLLGGDLFHECRPSPYCIYKCSELLRKYCLGDKAVKIEFLSDQSYHFQNQRNPIVNYEDPNLNIGIPVFSIHGNHDDPTGNRQISAMDVLASTGLINYFGRVNDFTKIEIKPILLQKGKTKLALYGLSHVKDERLGRLFRDKKVHMKKPEGDDWFNMLVLHQNRAARGVKNFIPDSALPDFMHLVIWGHEHDQRIEPEELENGVHISQPGSSIATSLTIGESFEKKVGLLHIYGDKFKMIPIPLSTVRPFLIEELILEHPSSDKFCLEKPGEQAMDQVREKIEDMIAIAASRHSDQATTPPLPLLRLKVFYHEEQQQFNAVRIGMQFAGRVANPDDIIKLNSLISKERKKRSNLSHLDEDQFENFVNVDEWATCVEDVIIKYFEADERKKSMTVLPVKPLTDAVSRFVKYSDSEEIKRVFDSQIKVISEKLIEMDPDIDNLNEAIEILMDRHQSADNSDVQIINDPVTRTVELSSSIDESEPSTSRAIKRGVSRGRPRGTTRRGRGSRASNYTSLSSM